MVCGLNSSRRLLDCGAEIFYRNVLICFMKFKRILASEGETTSRQVQAESNLFLVGKPLQCICELTDRMGYRLLKRITIELRTASVEA